MSDDGIYTRVQHEGDRIVIHRVQDADAIIEWNKRAQTMPQDRKAPWHHYARIPNIIYEQWFTEAYERGEVPLKIFGPEMDRVVERKLRDPDWKFLRVDGGLK
jgi:hypothetical protein